MKENHHLTLFRTLLVLLLLSLYNHISAQGLTYATKQPNDFWKNVQFGGGIGLNFSSGYTDVFLAPSAIYNFNHIVALGAGINLNYVDSNNYYSSLVYGISTIVLINPIPEIQFSVGLNESRVNYQEEGFSDYSEDFWDTSLILGAGYRTGNVTIGVGYNVLQNDRYDTDPFVPFVRAYF
ncbi:hypothetical protein [Flavobacterium franklandianum]|uniref:Alpha-ketoglutarate decarboxylase n=1 Tax=Flavobacterium franklandianum TaxID=2594430 RepID=A0A553CL63_9FLAO|nr:hypothetical protein [Flavobacterium franklandianum]TRX21286.1 hypothetical protein FNW17_07995 [Flavobacterium franklandianum]